MGYAVGRTNSTQMTATQTIAVQPTTALHRPRFHGPCRKSGLRSRRNTGRTYAMYRPITEIAVAARYAVLFHNAGSTRTIEQTTHSQIELVGVPVRGLTCFHSAEPGSAPSRLNAYAIRELPVTDAMPQKNWATTQMNSRNLPSPEPAASMKI